MTETAILVLEPRKMKSPIATLVSWATLQSLAKLRRNLDHPDLVSFCWRKVDDSEPWVLKLMIDNSSNCINIIIANMK